MTTFEMQNTLLQVKLRRLTNISVKAFFYANE